MDKILTFIVNEYNEILLLKGGKNDPQFKKSFWYVVTGGCEKHDLTKEDTVKREIKEFIEKIQCYGDKEELYNVLKEALDKKLYFKIEKVQKF